jgi:hypothetical protein
MKATRKKGLSIHVPQLISWLLIWGIAGFVLWDSRNLPYKMEGAPGPGFFPRILAIGLGVLNLFYGTEVFQAGGKKDAFSPRLSRFVRPAGFVLMAFFVIVFWERLGAVSTVLFSSLFELKFLEGNTWARSWRIGLSVTAFTWVLFEYILGFPLPQGLSEPLFALIKL